MEIQNLAPVEWSNQLVLVTKQVADAYGCKPKRIHDNFTRAKEQFQEGVHYFKLQGEQLRQFKHYTEKNGVQIPPSTTHLYLWTYQGCARHCKMLNTKKAWEVFDMLERFYFGVLKGELPAPELPDNTKEVDTLTARFQKQFAHLVTELAVVYVLLMSNGTIKIGMTKDLTDRIRQIEAESGLKVWNFASTRFMPRDEAAALEQSLKEKYAADCLGGEFFDTRFLDVAAQL